MMVCQASRSCVSSPRQPFPTQTQTLRMTANASRLLTQVVATKRAAAAVSAGGLRPMTSHLAPDPDQGPRASRGQGLVQSQGQDHAPRAGLVQGAVPGPSLAPGADLVAVQGPAQEADLGPKAALVQEADPAPNQGPGRRAGLERGPGRGVEAGPPAVVVARTNLLPHHHVDPLWLKKKLCGSDHWMVTYVHLFDNNSRENIYTSHRIFALTVCLCPCF